MAYSTTPAGEKCVRFLLETTHCSAQQRVKKGVVFMDITTEQAKEFARMILEQKMEMPEYLAHYSKEFIGRMVKRLSDLTDEEAETWIKKYNRQKS